jgi:hypothetical protein
MERDIHGAWDGPEVPAGKAVETVTARASRKHNAEDYTVIVEMPDPLPVTEAELELLESELADFIADLLKK